MNISPSLITVIAVVFAIMMLLIGWLKYREHVHRHRDEHGRYRRWNEFRHGR